MSKLMKIEARGSRATALTASLATLAAGPALAQVPAEESIATIVVTARRMAELIQDVPITINAIGADEIEERGIRDTLDVIRAVPGVSLSRPNSGLLRVTIRGIGSDASRPTVGYYLDDVPIGTTQGDFTGAPDPMAFDLERVEVLKGPQGTLYGASAMGGAIKFISQRPQLDAFDYKLDAEASSTDGGGENYDGRAVLNMPVGSAVAARVGVLYRDNGGFIDRVAGGDTSSGVTSFNPTEGEDVNQSQTLMLRGALLIEPDPTFRIIPAVVHQDNERDQVDSFWTSLPEFSQSNVVEQPNDDSFDLYTLVLEKEFGGVTLSSITGLFDRDQSATSDYTFFIGGLVPPFASQASRSDVFTNYENTTQEIRLTSSGEGPLSWSVGGFYSDDTLESGQDAFTQDATSMFGVPPTNGIDDVVFTQRSRSVTKQQAAFGEVSYDWTDRLATSLGLRYYDYQQSFRRQADGLFNGGPSGSDEDAKSDGTVARISASYELAEGHLAYVSATEGFRIGGSNSVVPSDLCATDLNALALTSAPSQYDPDELWSYELGTKNTLLDSRVVLNGAVFYNDWTKLQQVVDLRSCGFSFTGNVGEAHSEGVEVEFRGRLTRDFDVAAGVAYTKSVIDEGAPGVDAEPGDRVLHTPKWTVNLSANYERALSSGAKVFARADYQWRDRQFASFSPGVGETEEGYGVTNVSIGLIYDNWALRLFVDNLENEDPRLDLFDAFNITASTLRPRTVGLKLSVHR